MSSTTPAMYYWYFVERNCEDFFQRPDDVRLGFNAAISAFHMADVFWEYYKRHDPSRLPTKDRVQFLRSLGRQERSFVTVQTAATVYKHLYSSKPFLDAGSPQGFAGIASARPRVRIESKWRASGAPFVAIKDKNGVVISLNDALEAVVHQLWPSILKQDLA